MNYRMTRLLLTITMLCGGHAFADARLDRQLGLDMDQARQVQQIQKQYRRTFAAKRQELKREERRLRRARIANDSAALARQQRVSDRLLQQLRDVRAEENELIRRVLTPAQRQRFEAILAQRNAMVGSSRDASLL